MVDNVAASQKRLISFDEAVLNEAEQRLRESGGNLSEFVNAAVLNQLHVMRGRELLAKDDVQFGPVSSETRARVAAEWPA